MARTKKDLRQEEYGADLSVLFCPVRQMTAVVQSVAIEKGNSFSSVFFSGLLPLLLNLMLNTLFLTKIYLSFCRLLLYVSSTLLKGHCHTIIFVLLLVFFV